jgi:hypothetical protein
VRVGALAANVWDQIVQAGLVIADVSAANVNVFYELGLAHALGKDTLLLKQKDAPMPADFGGAHYYEYDLDHLDVGRDWLRSELAKWAVKNRAAEVKALYRP